MYDVTEQELKRVIDELDQAGHGMKGAVLETWCRRLSPNPDDPMSTATLRKRIRDYRGKAKEAPGRPKEIDRELVLQIAKMKAKGMEAGLGDRELATEIAQEMAERNGVDGATDVSVSSINRILRDEVGFRQRKRYRKVEADHAGQAFLFDFSRSKYIQVRGYDDAAGDYLLEVSGKQLSYKDPSGAFRTWYAMQIDDHSRVRLARMFCATGESSELGLEFLRWAWTREEDDHPMRHVPRKLQTDFGAFRKSKRVQRAFESLEEVDLVKASKDAQGKVERSFRTLWQRFELPFAVEHGDGYQLTLTDLNALLHEHMIAEAQRAHPSRSRVSCEHVYRTSIVRDAPLQTDVDIARLAFDVRERTVDAHGCVSVDGEKWLCPESVSGIAIEPGMRVRVQMSTTGDVLGRLIERHHEKAFRLEPWEQPAYDDMDADGTGRTRQEELRSQVDITAPIREDLNEDSGDGQADADTPSIAYLSARPEEVTANSDFLDVEDGQVLDEGTARTYVGRRLRSVGETFADAADVFGPLVGSATQDELDTVLDHYIQTSGSQREAM